MAKNSKGTIEEVIVPEKVVILSSFGDKVKSAQFTIIFPDGRSGVLILTKVTNKPWQPSDDITKLDIHWHD